MSRSTISDLPANVEQRRGLRPTALHVAALLGICALAAWLRVYFADAEPSYDELWHLALTTGRGTPMGQFGSDVVVQRPWSQTSLANAPPAWAIWTSMRDVLHPPLYIFLLRGWRAAFGDGDAAARALSNVCSIVAIVFSYAAVRLATGRGVALLVALALACSPTQIWFGQEMRSYAMLTGIAAIALWLMTRIEVRGPTRGRAIALGIAPLALLLTHYFAAGAAAGIAVYGFARLGRHRKGFTVALVSGALVYAVAWLPFAIQQLRFLSTGDSFVTGGNSGIGYVLLSAAVVPWRLLIDRPLDVAPFAVAFGLLFIVPWPLARRRLPALWPWAIWLTSSVAALAVLDVVRHTGQLGGLIRYAAVATPAVLPVAVGCAWAIDRRLAYALAATLAFACAIHRASNVGIDVESPGFERAAIEVARRAAPGEALITYHGDAASYCGYLFQLHCSHVPGFFPRPIVDLSQPMTPAIRQQLPRRAWLLAATGGEPLDVLIPDSRVLWSRAVELNVTLTYLELSAIAPEPASAPAGP